MRPATRIRPSGMDDLEASHDAEVAWRGKPEPADRRLGYVPTTVDGLCFSDQHISVSQVEGPGRRPEEPVQPAKPTEQPGPAHEQQDNDDLTEATFQASHGDDDHVGEERDEKEGAEPYLGAWASREGGSPPSTRRRHVLILIPVGSLHDRDPAQNQRQQLGVGLSRS